MGGEEGEEDEVSGISGRLLCQAPSSEGRCFPISKVYLMLETCSIDVCSISPPLPPTTVCISSFVLWCLLRKLPSQSVLE